MKDSYRQTHKAHFIMVQAELRKECEIVIESIKMGGQG